MGIHGIKTFFETCITKHDLSEYKNKIVLIDGMYVLYKQCIGRREFGYDHCKSNGASVNHLQSIFTFTCCLLEKNIIPVFVFDGYYPEEKSVTVKRRSDNKIKSQSKCNSIADKSSEEYIRHFKRSLHISSSNIADCKALLLSMGVCVIQAQMEADSQLAALSNEFKKEIAGIITEDSDVLIYGGTKILKEFSFRTNSVIQLDRLEMLDFLLKKSNTIRKQYNMTEFTEFTQNNLIDFGIIMGTDYKSKNDKIIYYAGLSNAEKREKIFEMFVINDLSVVKLIENIKNINIGETLKGNKHLYNVPADFITSYIQIKNIYLEHDVINKSEIKLILKTPNITNIINILCNQNDFEKHFVDKKIKYIVDSYNTFAGIIPYKTKASQWEHFAKKNKYRYVY